MGQKAMKSDIDPENAEGQQSCCRKDDAGPAEERRQQREHRQQMAKNETDQSVRFQLHWTTPSAPGTAKTEPPQFPRAPAASGRNFKIPCPKSSRTTNARLASRLSRRSLSSRRSSTPS